MTISILFRQSIEIVNYFDSSIRVLRLTLLSYRDFERSALDKLVGMAYQKYMVNLIFGLFLFAVCVCVCVSY